MRVSFVIGASEYVLEETDAAWLASLIRTACVDGGGRAWDREARAALQVADVIDEDLVRRSAPKPIELGRATALGLLHAFHDTESQDVYSHVATSDGVAALYLGLRRFVLEAPDERRFGTGQ